MVGPELKLHQCGLPKKMALELFKPFIYPSSRNGPRHTIKAAKKMVEKDRPEVWDILEEVIREHPVLLEPRADLASAGYPGVRAGADRGQGDPAASAGLHRLQRRLRRRPDGGACAAVDRSPVEARVLMMSTNNILSPANGKPIIVPTQDIVLGLYYLSLDTPEFHQVEDKDAPAFGTIGEIEYALHAGAVGMHDKIKARWGNHRRRRQCGARSRW